MRKEEKMRENYTIPPATKIGYVIWTIFVVVVGLSFPLLILCTLIVKIDKICEASSKKKHPAGTLNCAHSSMNTHGMYHAKKKKKTTRYVLYCIVFFFHKPSVKITIRFIHAPQLKYVSVFFFFCWLVLALSRLPLPF